MSNWRADFETWLDAADEPPLPVAGWAPEKVLATALMLEITDRRVIANAMALVDTAGRYAVRHQDISYDAIATALLQGTLPEASAAWHRRCWWYRLVLVWKYRPYPIGWGMRVRARRIVGGAVAAVTRVLATARREVVGPYPAKLPPGAVVWEPKRGQEDDDWPSLLSGEG